MAEIAMLYSHQNRNHRGYQPERALLSTAWRYLSIPAGHLANVGKLIRWFRKVLLRLRRQAPKFLIIPGDRAQSLVPTHGNNTVTTIRLTVILF